LTAIWLLSTRGRPDATQEVLDACETTGMTSPGVVYVDEDTGLYDKLRLPFNWRIHREPVWGSLQASMQWVYRQYPRATQYGWLADDTVPRTNGWDKELEASAGDHAFSHARDLWNTEGSQDEFENGLDMSAGLCWGGELVRAAGWWALPGVRQAGIDTAWLAILAPFRLVKYRHDVIVEHKHYLTGKRKTDQGDSWFRDGVNYVQADIDAREEWVSSTECIRAVLRIGMMLNRQPDRKLLMRYLIDAKMAQVWHHGMPAVRLQNLTKRYEEALDNNVTDLLGADTDTKPA
jgi:hypothetical protein